MKCEVYYLNHLPLHRNNFGENKMATNKNANYFDMFSKSFGDFRMPSVDYNAFFAIHRRNAEAAANANQLATENVKAANQRFTEIVKSNIEDSISAMRDVWTAGSPDASAAKQAEISKSFFQKNMNYAKELAEMASKSSIEVMDVVNRRVAESIEEVTKAAKSS